MSTEHPEFAKGTKKINKIAYVTKAFLMRESDRKIVVLTRSDNKKITPGRWEYSAGGAIDEGETPEIALRREMMEEIKMETGDLDIFAAEGVYNHYTNNFDVLHYFFGFIKKNIKWFEKDEVKAVSYYSVAEINALIEKHGEDKFDLAYIPAFRKLEKYLKERKIAH